MISLKHIRSRSNKATDSLVNYLPLMKMDGDDVLIQKQETYRINMKELTCSCHDFQFHGRLSPCKHLFLALIFVNEINHKENSGTETL